MLGKALHRVIAAVADHGTGNLDVGARLPTARQLAVALGVNPRMVDRAYAELERLGVVMHRPGTGTFVSVNPPPEAERERYARLAEICRDALTRAETLGFTANEVIDGLAELREARREHHMPRGDVE